jgi:glycosyltransferase involved in cell wall biosynthesis
LKRVLIAHQSTIPHYRVPFYNALQKLKPYLWNFDVIFDQDFSNKKRIYKEKVELSEFRFNTLPTNTFYRPRGKTYICFQDFIFKLKPYDLIIVEHAVNNLSYPLSHFYQLFGKKLAYWGHGRHISAINPGRIKRTTESIKKKLLKHTDGYFAYTDSVKDHLIKNGYTKDKIFVLNNTIDILNQRYYYDKYIKNKQELKAAHNLTDKKVLLMVGRLTHTKRLAYLSQAFNHLVDMDSKFHLIVIGDGNKSELNEIKSKGSVSILGSLTKLDDLAPYYIMSDLFVFPGQVGLGPLQALCYSLPIITVSLKIHAPEFDYLNKNNSIVTKYNTTPFEFAQEINAAFNSDIIHKLRSSSWDSIKDLTIEKMAKNMVSGINSILNIH